MRKPTEAFLCSSEVRKKHVRGYSKFYRNSASLLMKLSKKILEARHTYLLKFWGLEIRGECLIERKTRSSRGERLCTKSCTRVCTWSRAAHAYIALYYSFLSTGRWYCTQCYPSSLNLGTRHLDFANLLQNHTGALFLFGNWTKIANRTWTGSEQIC